MEATLELHASDLTGQRALRVREVPREWTVGELVERLLARMGLVRSDAEGRPLHYRARLEREARHLHGSERVGDALRAGDAVSLVPEINAG